MNDEINLRLIVHLLTPPIDFWTRNQREQELFDAIYEAGFLLRTQKGSNFPEPTPYLLTAIRDNERKYKRPRTAWSKEELETAVFEALEKLSSKIRQDRCDDLCREFICRAVFYELIARQTRHRRENHKIAEMRARSGLGDIDERVGGSQRARNEFKELQKLHRLVALDEETDTNETDISEMLKEVFSENDNDLARLVMQLRSNTGFVISEVRQSLRSHGENISLNACEKLVDGVCADVAEQVLQWVEIEDRELHQKLSVQQNQKIFHWFLSMRRGDTGKLLAARLGTNETAITRGKRLVIEAICMFCREIGGITLRPKTSKRDRSS